MKRINKVAILGAGTMGARIAAHFANAGIPSYLFDIVPPDADGPALLAASEPDPGRSGKRFATDGYRAYCGHEHSPGCWHGFPVEWRSVPFTIVRSWLADGRVSKRAVKELW